MGGETQAGTGAESEGTTNDLLNGYTTWQFWDPGGGQGGPQKYLLCNPIQNLDLGISPSNTRPCFSWMAVMRHHGGITYTGGSDTGNDLPMSSNDYMTIWGFLTSGNNSANTMRASIKNAASAGQEYNQFWHSSGDGALSNGNVTVAEGDSDLEYANRLGSNNDNYYVMGGFCTAMTAIPNGDGYYSVLNADGTMGNQSSEEQSVPCGTMATNTPAFMVGKDESSAGSGTSPGISEHHFDGRIVEMAFWKSDQPLTSTDISSVRLYMKNKFGV